MVNNDYTHWEMYAIGGSAAPTINSQGNRFLAPNDIFNKEVKERTMESINRFIKPKKQIIIDNGFLLFLKVTKHEDAPESQWKKWNWRSEGDLMLNGAFFTRSGAGASSSYAKASSLSARPSSLISSITMGAGALSCKKSSRC